MLQLKIKTGRKHIPIFDLPTALGRKAAYQEIGDQIDALIAFMDDLGGDPDLEDSEAGMSNIDACGRLLPGQYVGSQDEDREPDDDAQGDQSWIEWHTRGTRKVDSAGGEPLGSNSFGERLREDDEDDDPAEQDDDSGQIDEDGINTAFGYVRYTYGASGPGCAISDEGGGNVEDVGQMWFVPAYSGPHAAFADLRAANDA